MYYNFYLFLVILAIISPVTAYNKNEVLKTITIPQDIVYSSTLIFCIYFGYILYTNQTIFIKKNNPGIPYLLLNVLLTSLGLLLGGLIIINEKIFRFKSLQKSVYLIILLILAICFYKKNINEYAVMGVLLVIYGSYLIDRNTS